MCASWHHARQMFTHARTRTLGNRGKSTHMSRRGNEKKKNTTPEVDMLKKESLTAGTKSTKREKKKKKLTENAKYAMQGNTTFALCFTIPRKYFTTMFILPS